MFSRCVSVSFTLFLCVLSILPIHANDIDPIVDCRLRDYIYRYATTQVQDNKQQQQYQQQLQLQTGLVYGHSSIYDALQLDPVCKIAKSSYPTASPTSTSTSTITHAITAITTPITERGGTVTSIYVAPSSHATRDHDGDHDGDHDRDDASRASHDGSAHNRPLFVSDLPTFVRNPPSRVQTSRRSSDLLIIYLLPGIYYMSTPLILTSHDNNLILTAYEQGSVTLTTALPITSRWELHSPIHNIWRTSCPECATVTKQANSRPLPTSPKAVNVPQFELYVDGQTQTLARWPNKQHRLSIFPDGYASIPTWLAAGPAIYDPTNVVVTSPERTSSSSEQGLSTYFQQLIGGSQAGDQFIDGVQRGVPRSHQLGTTGPIGFIYNASEFSNKTYANAGRGALVHALHDRYWGNWQWEVSSINTASHTVSLGWGGYQQNQGRAAGAEYFIENLLEELDQPQEWYYDEHTTMLYYKPNSTRSSPSSASISTSESLVSITGTPHYPTSNIHLFGLIFEHTHPTYLSSYITPSGGDWALHPNGAVYVEGCIGCSIEYNLFQNLGGNGIYLSGFNRNITIGYNEFVGLGDSAILSVGTTHGIDGTQGIHPYGNYIHHNIAHELGLYGKQTAFYFQAVTAHTTIQNNVVFNVPRAAICFNDGFGGGHVVSHNVLFNTVRETADHGAFNSWDRDAFVTRFANGNPSLLPALSYIHHNLILGNYESGWPIDHDDGSSWYVDTYNVLIYGGYKNLWGHDMVTTNNLYIHPDAITVSQFPTGVKAPACVTSLFVYPNDGRSGQNEIWSNNTCILRSFVGEALTSCNVTNILEPPNPITHDNQFYSPYDAVYTICGEPFLADGVTPNTPAFIPLPAWQTYFQQDLGSRIDSSLTLTPDWIIEQVQHILPL